MNIQNILNKNYVEAKKDFIASITQIKEEKLRSLKKIVAENLIEETEEDLSEANVVRQGRVKLIRVRIRGGKIQRRVKKSAIKGYTLRAGKLKRITAVQRLKMKRIQKRAAIKRRSKKSISLMKRKRSMRKLKALGVR
jgi:hypothetical protein